MPVPSSVLTLPKSDRRYRVGVIKQDKKGRWRGHPTTVNLQRYGDGLNSPLMATEPMAKWMKRMGII